MELKDVIALANAGFTRDDIMKLTGAETAPVETTTEKTIEAPSVPKASESVVVPSLVSEEPKAKAEPKAPEVTATPGVTDAQLEKLAQMINVKGAHIDVPPTRTIDDMLADRFKSLMVGDTKN